MPDRQTPVVDLDERGTLLSCLDYLAQRAAGPDRDGRHPTLRWILTNTIQETARHAGHLDILRERLDGATGR